MFKADGKARNVLRDTISTALSTSQFDSVPSLLASGKNDNEAGSGNNGQVPLGRRSPFLRDASPYMISVMGVNKSTPKQATQVENSTNAKFDPTSKLRSLSLRDITYTGFDENAENDATADSNIGEGDGSQHSTENLGPQFDKEVCFNCWSAGDGNKCLIHTETPRSIASDPGKNLSMCKNWNTGYLRRKYRSEDLQERFSQTSQSLVFDKSQKEFSTLEQPKHPIYRLLAQHVARLNFTYQRRQNVTLWFQSFIKKLKDGNFQGKRSSASAQILLLKSTIKGMVAVRKLSILVKDRHPKAPVTGTTTRERLGQEQVLVEKVVTINGIAQKCDFVVVGPDPVPKALYRARKYDPPPPITFVLKDEMKNKRLDFSSILPSPIQYATFGRKRTNENIAVGGLSAEMIVSRRFTGRFPPQYKNFTCDHKSVLVPPTIDEESPTFPTMEVLPEKLPYIRRELITPLDSRLPPAIMVKTGLRPDERHFYGINRPEQTGEEGDFGFRTSTWYSEPIIDDKIDTNSFRPSQSVATLNAPVHSPMRKMKVNETYPFRKELSRKNCVDDLYHLLLSDGNCSINKLQMFTCVGSQQCGYFMQNGNTSLPIGRVVTRVVRSWAFLQSESEESAIYEEERISLGLGGVVLKDRPRHSESMPSGVLTKNTREDVRVAILRRMPPQTVAEEAPEIVICKSSSELGRISTETGPTTEHTMGPLTTRTHDAATDPGLDTKSAIEFSIDDSSEEETDESHQLMNRDTPNSEQDLLKIPPNNTESKQIVKQDDTLVAESISQMIGETLKTFSNKPEDLIRLGMGIGASLGAQGFLDMGGGERENIGNESVSGQIHIETSIPNIESEGTMTGQTGLELNGADKNTSQSYSSEESKLENYSVDRAPIVDENNLVNFSDFNTSPQGLLNVIASTRVGEKRVKYLSYTFALNLPTLRNIEPIKPRSMADEWKETGYDPWSAGRQKTSSTFVRSVAHETKNWPKPLNRVDGPDFSNTAREFAALCTLCRHGKYRDLEEMINNPSWSLPIDYCDNAGNTLLMIACQNGNKRIAKLCLRRGSLINNQNLNGNSCLHFAFGYGFDDLGDYLISKGADDSLQNANALTCYEGLDMDEL